MKPELTKRQIKANETRDRIYQTALELLETQGYETIRIEDICQKAGVSIGSFYNYFSSKNDILELIFKKSDDYFKDQVSRKLSDMDAILGIVEYFRIYADYNAKTGITTLKHMYNPENKFFAKKRGMQEVLEDVISRGQTEEKIKKDQTVEMIVEYLFILARGVVFDWCLKDGSYNLPDKMIPAIQGFLKSYMC